MYDDFLEATTVLPDIHTVVDGKISNLVAKHYLAETCISLGLYDDAIRLASEVIDNPNTGLMKVRFGSHKSEMSIGIYSEGKIRTEKLRVIRKHYG
jgi:hypothetical protein